MSNHQTNIEQVFVDLDPTGWAVMTRDMELIRKIIGAIQARKDVSPMTGMKIEGYDDAIVMRHIEMLYNAGYIDGHQRGTAGGKPLIVVRDLSWSGHDFAATIQNESVWGTLKQKWSAADLAMVPLTVVKELGTALLKDYLARKIGLST
jgi:hypothetical protein